MSIVAGGVTAFTAPVDGYAADGATAGSVEIALLAGETVDFRVDSQGQPEFDVVNLRLTGACDR